MRALILNCTLKPSPAESNTDALADVVDAALAGAGVEVERLRVVDHDVKPGVSSDEGPGDAWPAIRARILASQILVMATPTWLGKPSSVAPQVCERMDAMLAETDDARLRTTKPAGRRAFVRYRYGDSNPGFRRERAAS